MYSFGSSSYDGSGPLTGLTLVDGALYGTTYVGGTKDDGIVFEVTTTGTEHVVYNFHAAEDGKYPTAGLTDAMRGLSRQPESEAR